MYTAYKIYQESFKWRQWEKRKQIHIFSAIKHAAP